MNYIRILWLFSVFTIGIRASTHWMVTENGLIQPRLDSPFEMANPSDLLAFLNQDTRWDNIINLYHDLSTRKDLIRRLWTDLERETDVNTQLALSKNCLRTGPLNLLDWYASGMEDGKTSNIPDDEYLIHTTYFGQDTDKPDCKKISSLTFSMFTFEHLEGMSQRDNLTVSAELSLPDRVSPVMTVDQFGHWLAGVLRKNSSSWLHYNMASLYWRVRGNAPKAMECSRRAVHYAPRLYKDIALYNMGTIFHRSKKAEEAIIVLGSAVDHNPRYSNNHFVLGNAYAVIGDFNNSIKNYDACLKLDPTFDSAKTHKSGVMCRKEVLDKMQVLLGYVSKLREDLQEYSQREAHWLKSQASFLRTMKHDEEFDYRNVEKNCEKMAELTGLNIKDLKKEGDKNSLIQYFFDSTMFDDKWFSEKGVHALESAYNLQRLIKHIEKHTNMVTDFVTQPDQLRVTDGKIRKEIGPTPEFTNMPVDLKDYMRSEPASEKIKSPVDDGHSEFESGINLYPPSMKINRNIEDFDKDPDWPSTTFCKEAASMIPKNLNLVYPVFMPFENKGLRLKSLLSDKIGVAADVEHELPWHPPICPHEKDTATNSQKRNQKSQLNIEVAHNDYLKLKLLEYVGNGRPELVKHMQEAEIGQRIYAAMQRNSAPGWLLSTLASLYWRVRGNTAHAIACLQSASRSVPARYRDVVLASLASVQLEAGHFDEALTAAEEAFRASLYEPATNFMLAQLNMVKKHRNTQLFHLKQVLRADHGFMNGVARSVLVGWACFQHTTQDAIQDGLDDDICSQVEPGVSMVCEKDGSSCHVANIHCISSRDKEGGSTLVRMLELKEDMHPAPLNENIDHTAFESVLANAPRSARDKAGHQRNYDAMRTTIDNALRGCGPRGCHNIQPEDLAFSEEDCTYQHLQLGYWLHIVSFRQLLVDSKLRLPPEITQTPPYHKKIPECRLDIDPSSHFFLERLSRADAEGWEPVLSLMHQFAETFNFFDYVALGERVARYVDMNPRDWVGLVAAGWWCGAGGHGGCALSCLMAASALTEDRAPLLCLTALLHIQYKVQDAKDVAYLMFYKSPKSKLEAFLVAVSHTNMAEYEQAVWMYRYALSFDEKFLPAKACLHATVCLMLFGDTGKAKPKIV